MKKLYIDIFEDIKGVNAFFSTKHGASEGSPYYNKEVFEQLGLVDEIPVQPQQVHEAHVEVIDENVIRKEICDDESGRRVALPNTDGIVTNMKGVLLTTVHADCFPVWFCDEERAAIGLVHAGWRGTLAGIAQEAVRTMAKEYGSDPAQIRVHIGPGISKCCFETGPEVIEAFREKWAFADEYAEPAGEKYYIDLKGINTAELLEVGIKDQNITVSRHCTCCEPEMFASYRREGGTYMRMGAGICLSE